MTTRVLITHGGGSHALAVIDANGDQVAVLEKEGDEFGDHIHSGSHATFTVAEHQIAVESDAG